MRDSIELRFTTGHPTLVLPRTARLTEHLTPENSPVLFGCRTGICGTCASRIQALSGPLGRPGDEEAEVLALACPGIPEARLVCQVALTADVLLVAPLAI